MGVFSAVKAFFSVNQWAQWVGILFAAFIGYQGWKAKVKNDAEKRINEKRVREQLEIDIKAREHIKEIHHEREARNQHAAKAIETAKDEIASGDVWTADPDSVSDELDRDILFGNEPPHRRRR